MASSSTTTYVTPSQPQTTGQTASGAPFIAYSEPGKKNIFQINGITFGSPINPVFNAVPGYIRRIRFLFQATGGVNGNSTDVAASADAPYNTVANIIFNDALGTPLMSLDGYSAFFLIPLYSGTFGLFDGTQSVASLPSYQAPSVGTTGTGDFQFASALCLEFVKGYGVFGAADQATLPSLQLSLNPAATVFTTAPPTPPTLSLRGNVDFYWLPTDVNIAPPGLGTSQQWFLQTGAESVGSGATQDVTLPRQGGYLSTIILILRDSTNARIDAWPSILHFQLDGIGEIKVNYDELLDDMAMELGIGAPYGPARPTGTVCLTRKTSLAQRIFGLFDTLETVLSTSPGTSMQVTGFPWGTITNAPAKLYGVLGQIIPSASLIQGLPEA